MAPGMKVTYCEIRSTFRAPIDFVYAWCTDYDPGDARLEKEHYQRRILSRTGKRVVYEDLEEGPHGWVWRRQTVTLAPPHHWHAESVGNYREWSLDYDLRSLPGGRTELTLKGRRRPTPLSGGNPPKAELLRDLRTIWRRFGRALERDYRSRER